jgi:hypothetical protein
MDPITQQILEQQRAIQAQPGFEGYQPSFSSLDEGIAALQTPTVNKSLGLTPMGIQQDTVGISGFGYQPTGIPDIKEIGKNIAINKAIDYGVAKLGLPKVAGTILGSAVTPGLAIGLIPPGLNPLTGIAALNTKMQSSLFGRSASIADYLQAKRTQKAIQRESVRDLQERINKGEFGSTKPTKQDTRRTSQYDRDTGNSGGGGGFSGHGGYGSSAERGAALHG